MNENFKNSLPIFAKLLAKQQDVNVVYGGSKASSNGSDIFIPQVKSDDLNLRKIAMGYIVRESSRIRNFGTPYQGVASSFESAITRLLDEALVEKLAMQKYPGARSTLNEMTEVLVSLNLFGCPDSGDIPKVFLTYLNSRVRSKFLHQPAFNKIVEAQMRYLLRMFSRQIVEDVNTELDAFNFARNQSSTSDIAKKIVNVLFGYYQSCPSISDTGSEAKGAEGDDKDGDAESEVNGDAGDDKDGDAENEVKGAEGDDKDGDAESEVKGTEGDDKDGDVESEVKGAAGDDKDGDTESEVKGAAGDDKDGDTESEVKGAADDDENGESRGSSNRSALGDLLNADFSNDNQITDNLESLLDQNSCSNTRESKNVLTISNEIPVKIIENGESLISSTKSATSALRYKLERLLETQTQSKRYYSKRGKIVPERVWRLKSGNTKVFESETFNSGKDTSILFLVDASDSMGSLVNSYSRQHTRLSMAIESVLALSLSVFDFKGVSAAVGAFPLKDKLAGTDNGVGLLLDFNERPQLASSKFASVVHRGSTPIAEAIMWGVYKLLSHKSDRKILFVATDGQPNNLELAASAIKVAAQFDVEVMGIGLGLDIQHFVKDSVAVNSIEEMPQVVFSLFSKKFAEKYAA